MSEYSNMLFGQPYRLRLYASLALFWLGLLHNVSAAQHRQLVLDPARTRIEWTLGATMHTVHGTFTLKRGAITFDSKSGDAAGEIVVDATSGESGNRDRDADMHKKVLQSESYPEVVYFPKHVIGSVAEQGKSNVQVQGILQIHGSDHDLTLSLPVEKNGSEINTVTTFVVPYQNWGMKNPSKAFLHVDGKVEVRITAVGQLTTPSAH